MIELLLTRTLASIVTENHKTAAVLEKYQLDFCCKGKRTLQEACKEGKVNPAAVLYELEKKIQDTDSNEMSPATFSLIKLVQYIINTHHVYVKSEMPVISSYLARVSAKHGDRHPELLKIAELFDRVKMEMEIHMQKEEQILFPRILEIEEIANNATGRSISENYISGPVSVMMQEHDLAGALLAEIAKLSNNYTPPPDACTTYKLSFGALKEFELDLHRHVHLENNVLFPQAIQSIAEAN